MPDMPTPRSFSTAVHIPNLGVLVLGGINQWFSDKLDTAEILRAGAGCLIRKECNWSTVSPMLEKHMMPLAAWFNNRVFVSQFSSIADFEMLSLSAGPPGQWTRLDIKKEFCENFSPWSLVNFNERLLLAGLSFYEQFLCVLFCINILS